MKQYYDHNPVITAKECLTGDEKKAIAAKYCARRVKSSPNPSWQWLNEPKPFTKWAKMYPREVFVRAAIIASIDPEVVISLRRGINVEAKDAALYVCRALFPMLSFPELREIMGLASHSTIVTAKKRAEKKVVRNDLFRRLCVLIYLACQKFPTPIEGPKSVVLLIKLFGREGLLLTDDERSRLNTRGYTSK